MATTDLVTQRMNAIVEKEGGNSAGTIEEALGGQVDETLTNKNKNKNKDYFKCMILRCKHHQAHCTASYYILGLLNGSEFLLL
jgi:hypothetical protein